MSSSDAAGPSGPELQLLELRDQVQAGNAELYRHLALYLQVLRQVLPVRVERSVFHLATQVQPRRYALLPAHDRQQLHRRLQSLVHRCTSLLTVEQLVSLASQMARERERQERRERQRLLQRFTEASSDDDSLGLNPPSPALGLGAESGGGDPSPPRLPQGSVNLDGSRPFSAGLLQGLAAPFAFAPLPAAALESQDDPQTNDRAAQGDAGDGTSPETDPGEAMDVAWGDGEATNQNDDEDDPPDSLPSLSGLPLPPLLQKLIGDQPRRSATGDPWRDARLPDDPLLLLRWLEGVEQALTRRLRNLSHAVNVELLRSGLSGTLLPVSLLDGVLAGQIEVQPAPPNLLRLQLPFPAEDASPLLVMAVLLRRVDLELEEPRLRTCRRRLQQHRQEVRRMAQQFRRLQRRREAHEAEQLWLQDRHASLSPPG